MKKQMNLLKLSGVAALMAVVSVGCASSDTNTAGVDGSDRSTVSALSFSPETRPYQLNKWPIEWNLRSIDTYTFVVPDDGMGSSAMADVDVDSSRTYADVDTNRNQVDMDIDRNRVDVDTNRTRVDVDAGEADVKVDTNRSGVDVDVDTTRPRASTEFSTDLPEGSVFVEAAGAESGATSGRRVIQHSPFTR